MLARLLAELMIANVQQATALNRSAADTLLARAKLAMPARFDQADEAWRMSWRSFEICATTADRVIGLTREHAQRTSEGLWRAAERLFSQLSPAQAAQLEPLRHAFTILREAQETYLRATQTAHQRVIALAQGLDTAHATGDEHAATQA